MAISELFRIPLEPTLTLDEVVNIVGGLNMAFMGGIEAHIEGKSGHIVVAQVDK